MSKTVTMRLENNVYDMLKRAADGSKRSISNFMEYAVLNYILNDTVVDDIEMAETAHYEKDLRKGLRDIARGRYEILG